MYRIIHELIKESKNPNFFAWQNKVAESAKSSLKASYDRNANEVSIVTSLCNELNNREISTFNRFELYAKKIHGKASSVSFKNESYSDTTRELSDMIVLSLITDKGQVLYARIAFVQNKKEKDNTKAKWDIDQDQLYLLTNFPTFNGVSGIFGETKNIVLPDPFQQLGSYGLFRAPCEMVFASANVITALKKVKRISYDDIKNRSVENKYTYPYSKLNPYYLHKYDYFESDMPILGNCSIALNIHQFIRNWTQFNIGKEFYIKDILQCSTLTKLTNDLLKKAELPHLSNLEFVYNTSNEPSVDLNIADCDTELLVVHLDIGDYTASNKKNNL